MTDSELVKLSDVRAGIMECDASCWAKGSPLARLIRTTLADLPTTSEATIRAEHGGYRIFRDGDMWCAVAADFVNLQESPAAFAVGPVEALSVFIKEQGE